MDHQNCILLFTGQRFKSFNKVCGYVFLQKANSEGIVDAIQKYIKNVNDVKFQRNVIDENVQESYRFQKKIVNDFWEKLVACNWNGASSILGNKEGVRAKISWQQ